MLALGGIVFSNQVYLKKNLEFESTLSIMSRVIARAEAVEGYQPGSTPVAIIGTPEHSILSVQRKGFEHLSALDAANANYAIANDTDMIWYIWEVMGYPFNFVSTYELEQIKQYQKDLITHIQENKPEILEGIRNEKVMTPENEEAVKEVLTSFAASYAG